VGEETAKEPETAETPSRAWKFHRWLQMLEAEGNRRAAQTLMCNHGKPTTTCAECAISET
jgi:hypothetical protein